MTGCFNNVLAVFQQFLRFSQRFSQLCSDNVPAVAMYRPTAFSRCSYDFLVLLNCVPAPSRFAVARVSSVSCLFPFRVPRSHLFSLPPFVIVFCSLHENIRS